MKSFKHLDLYRKPSSDHAEKTYKGGIITLTAASIMLILFLSETELFLSHTIIKDTILDQKADSSLVKINIDITLPYIPCIPLSLDYQNELNSHILDYTESLQKIRISKSREPILDDVEKTSEELINAINNEEGCRIKGYINVTKVPGNFHISLHVGHDLLHSIPNYLNRQLKFSHIINSLTIGDDDPAGGLTEELEIDDFGAGRFIGVVVSDIYEVCRHGYFLKIIPKSFVNECNGSRFDSFGFSMNMNTEPFLNSYGAIYFRYSFEEMTMRYRKVDKRVSAYLVSLCAILGGVFTVLGIVNKIVS